MKNRIEILMQWCPGHEESAGPYFYWSVTLIKHMGPNPAEPLHISCGTWEQVTEQVEAWIKMFPPNDD